MKNQFLNNNNKKIVENLHRIDDIVVLEQEGEEWTYVDKQKKPAFSCKFISLMLKKKSEAKVANVNSVSSRQQVSGLLLYSQLLNIPLLIKTVNKEICKLNGKRKKKLNQYIFIFSQMHSRCFSISMRYLNIININSSIKNQYFTYNKVIHKIFLLTLNYLQTDCLHF